MHLSICVYRENKIRLLHNQWYDAGFYLGQMKNELGTEYLIAMYLKFMYWELSQADLGCRAT
jgi:hypothetical protein